MNKKNLTSAFVIASLAMFSFSACDSEVENDLQSSNKHSEKLEIEIVQSRIDSLNQSIVPQEGVDLQTKGLRSWFRKVLKIVAADAVGAIVGGVGGPIGSAAGAITASGVAVFRPDHVKITPINTLSVDQINSDSTFVLDTLYLLNHPMKTRNIALNNVVPYKDRVIHSINDSIGYYHNEVLLNIKKDIKNNPLTLDHFYKHVAAKTSVKYNKPTRDVIMLLHNNNDFYHRILNYQYANRQFKSITHLMSQWKLMLPHKKNELNLLESFLQGISKVDATMNNGIYLEKVLNIIDTSNLNDDFKQDLRNGFIVGNASYQLWEEQN